MLKVAIFNVAHDMYFWLSTLNKLIIVITVINKNNNKCIYNNISFDNFPNWKLIKIDGWENNIL